MVFNATFNINISYIVVVSFIGGGNQSTQVPAARHWQTISNNVVSSTPRHGRD